MMERPSPQDWLNETRDMTPAQRGAIIDFICLNMLEGAAVNGGVDELAAKLQISLQRAGKIYEALVVIQEMEGSADD